MRHFNKLAVILLLFILLCSICIFNRVEAQVNIDYDAKIQYCDDGIKFYTDMKTNANAMANNARALGYSEDHIIIYYAKRDWENANRKVIELTAQKEELIAERDSVWTKRKNEYPVATEIWLYLSEQGYSDVVIAGILGNMMAETGGHTLNIEYKVWDSSRAYYGICQWSLKYNPQLSGTDLNTQLEHLINSMEYEFNTFGYKYKANFKYDNFINMSNVEEAATAFAQCYERCASSTYGKRRANALKAYKYFVG